MATGPISHLLVTTKAYDVAEAVTSIASHLSATSEVLVIVNGMGIAEDIAAICPYLRPYFGTTTEGAYRDGPQRVRHAGRGRTLIGREGLSTPPTWFEPWRRATADCRWESQIDRALWGKLAINCAINPLTAVYGCSNGELLSSEVLRNRVDLLCAEIAEVATAEGYGEIAANLRRTIDGVLHGTAANYSSMLQDLRAGRRTEIDYITGYLLRIADRHGIATPGNRDLYREVSRLDDSN